jgi:hypothetical protein
MYCLKFVEQNHTSYNNTLQQLQMNSNFTRPQYTADHTSPIME